MPTFSKPTKVVAQIKMLSTNEIKATKATRLAIMLRIKLMPREAPFDAASRSDESVLEQTELNEKFKR